MHIWTISVCSPMMKKNIKWTIPRQRISYPRALNLVFPEWSIASSYDLMLSLYLVPLGERMIIHPISSLHHPCNKLTYHTLFYEVVDHRSKAIRELVQEITMLETSSSHHQEKNNSSNSNRKSCRYSQLILATKLINCIPHNHSPLIIYRLDFFCYACYYYTKAPCWWSPQDLHLNFDLLKICSELLKRT